MAGRIKGFFDRSEDSEDDMVADLSAADAVIAPPKLRSSNFSSGILAAAAGAAAAAAAVIGIVATAINILKLMACGQ